MFCGTGSFSHVDDEEDPTAVKKKRSSGSSSSSRRSKNPYSTRGLDKFSKVISELEERREKIMARAAGSQAGIAMVRFMYSNSQDWIPIIVKLREEPLPPPARKSNPKKQQPTAPPPLPLPPPEPTNSEATSPEPTNSEATSPAETATEQTVMKKEKKRLTLRIEECWRRWRPNYYWPVVMIVILVCLVMFGRAFAICCTSIWWYLSPTLMGCDDLKRSMKKRPPGCGNPPPPSSQTKRVVQELTSPRSHRVINGKKG